MGTFNENGYIRERLDEWVTKVKNLYFVIFGNNIDLSSDTMDGQLTGAFAESLSNEDQKAEAVYKSFSPTESEGVALSTLVKINGVTRNDATFSVVTLDMIGTNGTFIPAGSVVRNSDTDEPFATDAGVTISAGVGSTSATAQNSGAVIASAGSLTVIDTNIAGWTSVTNANDATVGSDEETDEALRIRRNNSVAISSQGNVDSVSGALNAVDGVISAIVKENKTNGVDGDGIDPHAIACIVEGGTLADIANTIWLTKSGGCDTFGTVTETIQDSQGFDQDISFDRPTDVDIWIDVAVTSISDFPSDGDDQIKQAIIDYFENDEVTKLLIGDDVIYSEIYVPAMSITGVYSITSLTLGIAAVPVGTVDISIDFDELARFDTARIDVVVT